MFVINSDGVLLAKLRQICNRVLPESIVRQCKGRGSIQHRQELGRVGRIFWPKHASGAVGIEMRDEVDNIVRYVCSLFEEADI